MRKQLALLLMVVLALAAAGCNPQSQSASSEQPTASSAPIAASPQVSQAAPSDADIVYATRTGKHYHRAGCRSLSRSDIPMTRAQAKQLGLTPCSICNP